MWWVLSVGFFLSFVVNYLCVVCPFVPRKSCMTLPVEYGNSQDLVVYLTKQKEKIKGILRDNGMVLLRNFSMDENAYALDSLGYNVREDLLSTSFKSKGASLLTILGRQPRHWLSSGVFRSTKAPSSRIIGPHTELAFMGHDAPDVVGFHVLDYGNLSETPLIDMEGVWTEIKKNHPNLYHLLKHGRPKMSYVMPRTTSWLQRLYGKLVWGQPFKTMDEAFDGLSKENANQFEWKEDGNRITASLEVPLHHEDRTLLWCSDFWGSFPYFHDLDFYGNRYSYLERWMWKALYWLRKNYLWFDPDPTRGHLDGLTKDDLKLLYSLMRDPKFYLEFQWQKGDFLIINNKKIGHSRAPRGTKKMSARYGWK